MRLILSVVTCVALPMWAAWGADLPRAPEDADFRPVRETEARLGQLLFYDPVLSGNREVACATCHHPAFGTSDGLSLGVGDGGIGLGPDRRIDPENPPEERVPRNAQALFNLGARDFTAMFHDGRIEVDPARPVGFRTPLEDDMVTGFASILSAQSMFPVVSPDEMAGHYSENDVSKAVRMGRVTGAGGAWDIISRRVAAIPAYADAFIEVYPDIARPDDIDFTDISNAIAAFIAFEWRSDTSPFDAWLRGTGLLPEAALRGVDLFYGKAECARCHAGPFLSDQSYHAMAQPQFGPGKRARFETHARDEGRAEVTGRPEDMFAFRTPSLRNVALTAPYGHAGAYRDLASFTRAHVKPRDSLAHYDRAQAVLAQMDTDDWVILDTPQERDAILAASSYAVTLSEAEVADIVAFLETLTDPVAKTGRLGIPDAVPSGLRVPNP